MHSVIERLASSLGRRDEVSNMELAKQIAESNDIVAVKELIEAVKSKHKDIQNDSIKVIYEIGMIRPALICPYHTVLLDLLSHKNNRLQWGAMTALETITSEIPAQTIEALPAILKATESGSVITRDNAVLILIRLCAYKEYKEQIFPLLIEQFHTSPVNQLPMYAERAFEVVSRENADLFIQALRQRLPEIDQESKRKRVEKMIKKASVKLK